MSKDLKLMKELSKGFLREQCSGQVEELSQVPKAVCAWCVGGELRESAWGASWGGGDGMCGSRSHGAP